MVACYACSPPWPAWKSQHSRRTVLDSDIALRRRPDRQLCGGESVEVETTRRHMEHRTYLADRCVHSIRGRRSIDSSFGDVAGTEMLQLPLSSGVQVERVRDYSSGDVGASVLSERYRLTLHFSWEDEQHFYGLGEGGKQFTVSAPPANSGTVILGMVRDLISAFPW